MPDIDEIAELDDDDDDYYNGSKPLGPGFMFIRRMLWRAHLAARAKVAALGEPWVTKCIACGGLDSQACLCAADNYSPSRVYIEQYVAMVFEAGRRKREFDRIQKRREAISNSVKIRNK
jgi:hypothetical protein